MKKEFLEDYERKWEEFFKKYVERLSEGDPDAKYPPPDAFIKLQKVVSWATPHTILVQIPFAESLIIPVVPRKKEEFEELLGVGSGYLDRLIDLCKESGRVQFAITKPISNYQGLDYLEPLFTEIKPPIIFSVPPHVVFPKEEVNKCFEEFYKVLKNSKFIKSLVHESFSLGIRDPEYMAYRTKEYAYDYAVLKLLGFDQIIELISMTMHSQPSIAHYLFNIFSLVTVPLFSPLDKSYSIIRNTPIDLIPTPQLLKQNNVFVPEIGKFIFRKLTLLPDSYEGAISVIDRFKQAELYKLYEAIVDACTKKKTDEIISKGNEMGTVLDNIWNEAKGTRKLENLVRYGIPVDLVAVGKLIEALSGQYGLLASLGFDVAGILFLALSEKITKFICDSSLLCIYNFQKKYKLEDLPMGVSRVFQ